MRTIIAAAAATLFLMLGALYAAKAETGSKRFHCGKEWITFPRSHLDRGLVESDIVEAPIWVTMRKSEIARVYVPPFAKEGLHGQVSVREKGLGGEHYVPRQFHRQIVECLD